MINTAHTARISTFALIMLISGAIDSIRNLPATAMFGESLLFFLVAAGLLFLLPTALISAELAGTWRDEGGIYFWVKKAFGENSGLVAIWLQWINTVVWYPTILSFIAATLAFLIDPHLVQNKAYMVSVIVVVFWLMTLLNLRGVQTSARFASFCAVVGLLIPIVAIISLGITWVSLGKPLNIHLSLSGLFPDFDHPQSWLSLTAIITSFLGIELATVHIHKVANPKKTFPKAIVISMGIIFFTMLLGALAIAVVIPQNEINVVDGVIEALRIYLQSFHLGFLLPLSVVMILIGSIGGMINWIISPAQGLAQAAADGQLPHWLAKENQHGVAYIILLLQAVLVTALCTVFLIIPTVSGSYWLLTDLSTELYILMYMIMFVAAIWLKHKYSEKMHGTILPVAKWPMILLSVIGLFGCIISFIVGFIPPDSIDVGDHLRYDLLFIGGILLMVAPALLIILGKKVKFKCCGCDRKQTA